MLDWGPGGNFGGSSERDKRTNGPFGAMQGGYTVHYTTQQYLGIHMWPMSNVHINRTRRRAQGGRAVELTSNSAAGGWDMQTKRPHTSQGASVPVNQEVLPDLWWDILNPDTWLFGLPSVGRYDAGESTRQGGRAGGDLRQSLLPVPVGTLRYVTASEGKVGPWYRGPFLAQVCAWLMAAGMNDKIRRPDQTLLAE